MDGANMLCEIIFPLRCEFAIPDSARASCLPDTMHSTDMPGQIGARSKGLRASLTLEGSRMCFSMLPILNKPCLRLKEIRARGKLTYTFAAL
jgi:hypothetical protein